jgi:hypothetical protein
MLDAIPHFRKISVVAKKQLRRLPTPDKPLNGPVSHEGAARYSPMVRSRRVDTPCFHPFMTKGILMKRQWIPLVAAALVVGTMTVRADNPGRSLPVGLPSAGETVILAPAPEAIAAPMGAPVVQPAAPVIIMQDCCPDQQPRRQRREKFNLCDYWQILCACFYHG